MWLSGAGSVAPLLPPLGFLVQPYWRREGLSSSPPSPLLLPSQVLVRQDLCLSDATTFCCVSMVWQSPLLSVPGGFENSSSSPHLKVFHWVLEHCPDKFCAELNTKCYTVMLLSSGSEVAGKQTRKHKTADEISVHE